MWFIDLQFDVFAAQAHACAETLAGETVSEPLDTTMVRPWTWHQGRNRHDVCRISGLFRHSEIAHPKIRIARGPTEKRIPFLALSSASILGTCASYLQG